MKIAGEVGVDVSRQAWRVGYADAIATAEAITIEGVRVPFLSLEMLIKSKTTHREEDRADLVRLRDLLELKRQDGDAIVPPRKTIDASLTPFHAGRKATHAAWARSHAATNAIAPAWASFHAGMNAFGAAWAQFLEAWNEFHASWKTSHASWKTFISGHKTRVSG